MNIFTDPENKRSAIETEALVRIMLMMAHKGDPREVEDSLKRFIRDGELDHILADLEKLREQLYARWLELGFGSPPAEIEAPAEEAEEELYTEEPVVVELDPEVSGEEVAEEQEEEVEEISKAGAEEEPEGETEIEMEIVHEVPEEDREQEEIEVAEAAGEPEKKVSVVKRLKLELPNGKVGTKYVLEIPLDAYRIQTERILHTETKGFRDSGLSLDTENWVISGMPAAQGQLDLSIIMDYNAGEGRTGTLVLDGSCYINPDPRSLWQEKEPPSDAPYPKSHTDSHRLAVTDGILLGASRRGRSHAHKGDFRDDDFFLGEGSDGWLAIAVADGAGSANYSREGSRIACHHAGRQLTEDLNADFTKAIRPLLSAHFGGDITAEASIKNLLHDVLVGAIFEAYKEIVREAEATESDSRKYATTLLFSIAKRFGPKWFIASYWVGDGAIAAYKQGEWVKVLGQGDSGEFAGQTRFLTMSELWQDQQSMTSRLHFDIVDEFTSLVLMTDGVSDPKIQTDYNMQQVAKWDELWMDIGNEVRLAADNEQAGSELLDWLNFWSQGDHDDRTIAFLLQSGGSA